MNRFTAVALIAALSLSACKPPAPPAPPAAPAAPAAPQANVAAEAPAQPKPAGITIQTIDLGADNRITTALDTFKSTDTIIAAIALDNGSSAPVDASVGVRWSGPDGQPFNEEAQAKSYPPGAESISFRVADPKGLKPGNYKIEILLNGSTMQMKEFKVN